MRKNKVVNDIILIAVLVAAAVVFTFIQFNAVSDAASGKTVVVSVGGKTFGEYPLDADAEIDVSSLLTVVIKDGSVSVKDETCANRFCAAHAPISSPGQSIVCLPRGVVIYISGGEEYDAVV